MSYYVACKLFNLAIPFSTMFFDVHHVVYSYTTVFGQGMALRGPSGSMVKAVNGMVREQSHILYTFSITIFFLGVSTISTYYVVMNLIGAHICAAVTVLAMYFWHRQCLGIYNRFKWVTPAAEWTQHNEDELDINKYATSKSIDGSHTKIIDGKPVISTISRSSSISNKKKKKRKGFFAKFFSSKSDGRSHSMSSHNSDPHYIDVKENTAANMPRSGSRNNMADVDSTTGMVRNNTGSGYSNVSHEGRV